jgi:hypothetical protein
MDYKCTGGFRLFCLMPSSTPAPARSGQHEWRSDVGFLWQMNIFGGRR